MIFNIWGGRWVACSQASSRMQQKHMWRNSAIAARFGVGALHALCWDACNHELLRWIDINTIAVLVMISTSMFSYSECFWDGSWHQCLDFIVQSAYIFASNRITLYTIRFSNYCTSAKPLPLMLEMPSWQLLIWLCYQNCIFFEVLTCRACHWVRHSQPPSHDQPLFIWLGEA